MQSGFQTDDLTDAYKLVVPPVLIATKGDMEKLYDITPIGWIMPMDYEPVTKVIFSCDPAHQCDVNIKRSREFAVCLPLDINDPVIEKCGSVSSADIDKFARFGITGKKAEKTDLMIPVELVSSWIECRLVRVIREGSVDLFIGEAAAAFKK
ncbi:MAG: flavin reductase [Treponema sp.]|nr:flavin reductase [Treponema sp.]